MGNNDSAMPVTFMCRTCSVNPIPLPPAGRAGQRWRAERKASWNARHPLSRTVTQWSAGICW